MLREDAYAQANNNKKRKANDELLVGKADAQQPGETKHMIRSPASGQLNKTLVNELDTSPMTDAEKKILLKLGQFGYDTSEAEWIDAVETMKKSRGNTYPCDWYHKIVRGDLYQRLQILSRPPYRYGTERNAYYVPF